MSATDQPQPPKTQQELDYRVLAEMGKPGQQNMGQLAEAVGLPGATNEVAGSLSRLKREGRLA